MDVKKTHIVIVGAGMAGLACAHHLLLHAGENPTFTITVLEASHRIGGRILTSEIGGDRVELGATWIHGVDGSPLYNIAQSIGAIIPNDIPFERQDGFPCQAIIKTDANDIVDPSVAAEINHLYKDLLSLIRSHDDNDIASSNARSIGAFVRSAFDNFLSRHDRPEFRAIQEALLSMNEYMERVATSANTLHDLDLHAEKEYTDYPGEHLTIAKGYTSIINYLAASLPSKSLHFGKKVERFEWNRARDSASNRPVALYCSDGSIYEADHVIITVSLGILKSCINQQCHELPSASPEGRPVSRSIYDLKPCQLLPSSLIFYPPLPAFKVEAISRLGYGVVNKLFLQINPKALSSEELNQLKCHIQLLHEISNGDNGHSMIPSWMKKTFSITPIYSGSDVLLCWFAGGEALELERLSEEEVTTGLVKTLTRFGVIKGAQDSEVMSSGSDSEDSATINSLSGSTNSTISCSDDFEEDRNLPSNSNVFIKILKSSWGTNPFFQGSYSFVATGASGNDIEKLAEPLPVISNSINNNGVVDDHDIDICVRHSCNQNNDSPPLQLLFAGEATNRNFYSTTHGAYLSGLREANRLLLHLGLTSPS